MGTASLFSIGYAAYGIDQFIKTLKENNIKAIVDVRAMPWISHFEVYKRANIQRILTDNQIIYKFFGRLLGARPEDGKFYTNGKVDFKKIAASPDFNSVCHNLMTGLEKLGNICLMCAQIDPIICHRSILVTRHFQKLYPKVPILHFHQGSMESQEDLDKRLMKLYRRDKYKSSLLASLQASTDDELENAYAWQADKIAWHPE